MLPPEGPEPPCRLLRRETFLVFAGQYTDAESGLQYLRARYYDPATAQWLSRDPITDITQSPYGYTDGDPLNGTDPTGLNKCEVGLNPLRWGGNAVDCASKAAHKAERIIAGDDPAMGPDCSTRCSQMRRDDGKTPVVIGQDMGRVYAYARRHGYKTLNDFAMYRNPRSEYVCAAWMYQMQAE